MNIAFHIEINNNKQDYDCNFDIDLSRSMNEDYSNDYNYILRKEIIELNQNYKKEIEDLKNQNIMINEELKILK